MKQVLYFCIYTLLFFGLSTPFEAQTITFTPKWTAQAQFTGYYAADKMGFYKAEGLNVRIEHPSISESSFSFLVKGRAQIVVMNLSQALMARAAGVKVVNIMQTSQSNSLMLVGHSPLRGLDALKNKKVAVWNHLSQDLLDMLNKKYGLNIEWVRFNSGINLFLSKAVDICLVGSYNEFHQLKECGKDIPNNCIFRLADYGYDIPEDGVYVTEEYYNTHKELVEKFVRASVKGWIWAGDNTEQALDIVMKEIYKHNIGTNRYHQRKMLEEILHLQHERLTAKQTFKLSRDGFERSMKSVLPKSKFKELNLQYQDFVKQP